MKSHRKDLPTGVSIRRLGAGERQTLMSVFDGLSAASRWQRFLSPVHVLDEHMLRLLADGVDGRRHVAIVAERAGVALGIARYVQLEDGSADVAVEVVDTWQGLGIGTALVATLKRLVGPCVQRLTYEVAADNQAAVRLAKSAGGRGQISEGVLSGFVDMSVAAI